MKKKKIKKNKTKAFLILEAWCRRLKMTSPIL